ncbi:MAG: right-handed parallel beta-helix repeat-containing protein [Sediminibacterium sp.]
MTKKFSILLYTFFYFSILSTTAQIKIYVATDGNNNAKGDATHPVASFERAQQIARKIKSNINVQVIFKNGTYYLPNTIQFTTKDSKTNNATITYLAENEGGVVISGGARLNTKWEVFKKNIYVTDVPENTKIDQLYINGERQTMARYPNAQNGKNVFDSWDLNHNAIFDSAADVLLPSRVAQWQHPEGGYIHAMHAYLWGDMHWLIKGKDNHNHLQLEGGWQNNRPSEMHPVFRMVENIFEELDAPGEWYLNESTHKLYYYPKNENLQNAKVEIVRLTHLITYKGSIDDPIKNVHIKGFVFKHTTRTFMQNKDPLLRSDWTIYRGAAIVFNGAENCNIYNCEFDQVGGNTILVNHYNNNIKIKSCYIHHSGASGIVFVGDTTSVRNKKIGYGPQNYIGLDTNKGPLNNNYPRNCSVEDCIITMTGRVEKQTAPIQISIAYKIHINHCSIYNVPRAGINISEGAFGGHLIENSDIFNTVLETGDHGSFNSWGRDRYWSPNQSSVHEQVTKNKHLPFLDMIDKNIIRHNRWRCDHGWDIDLDDGSSQYEIYNNLLLNGGLKFREGYHRTATNNIIINNSFHPHVWYKESGDIFTKNVLMGTYKEILMNNTIGENKKWGKFIDNNFFMGDSSNNHFFKMNGCDSNSKMGDPIFKDPSHGDFTVQNKNALIEIGFVNFDMKNFGVISPKLKSIAKKPSMPHLNYFKQSQPAITAIWMGTKITEPKKESMSAFGVGFEVEGIAIGEINNQSLLHQIGFKKGDLIIGMNGEKTSSIKNFKALLFANFNKILKYNFIIIRSQEKMNIYITGKIDPQINIK